MESNTAVKYCGDCFPERFEEEPINAVFSCDKHTNLKKLEECKCNHKIIICEWCGGKIE